MIIIKNYRIFGNNSWGLCQALIFLSFLDDRLFFISIQSTSFCCEIEIVSYSFLSTDTHTHTVTLWNEFVFRTQTVTSLK